MTQGGRANKSGNVLEKNVEATLLAHGYVQVDKKLQRKKLLPSLLTSTNLSKRYARQVYVGQGIYGTDIYVAVHTLSSFISWANNHL
ncbi:hypothetical protein H6G17_11290 [Chroococcidiopsis sp. FACHB-1243]|uniref:PD-(D/E)XK nuclease superfamily protein n=1 Tax=Chroococcidiopsis sp. [FACHB-1243] TaxID=2692781 RepID=UPI001780604D|nr:PD-(D/E)XK nuclease superfamily protein [Chroococcidiopsis sp. [FACHB-1243]]MBD2306097.1 hypothetical protein [Chroococcidiopsis sp. [FACHB-1243]]